MADRKKLLTSLTATLVLVALNLIAFNVLLSRWSTARIDLTEEGIYSISPATKRILSSLEDDVLIDGYFSRRTHPKLAPLVPQIEDLLDEYRALSRGRVQVEILDPSQDPELEQEVGDRFGVRSTPFRLASKYESGIVNAYFAVVIRFGDQYVRYGFDELIDVEPMPDGDIEVRLRNLEYDLTRAMKKVVYGFRGATDLFDQVTEPVKLTSVISAPLPEIFEEIPDAVRKAAGELAERGAGKFTFEEIDPADEETQMAVLQKFGARPMSLGLFSEEQFYLYGFLETGDRIEQLILSGEGVSAATIREAIEDFLRRNTSGFLKTVGVVAPTPSIPPELMMQMQMQGRMPPQPPPEFQQIKRFLGQDYQVRDVSLDAPQGVPTDIDTLLVLKPKTLDEKAVYNIDQYLMRGGRVIVCAGNYEVSFGGQTGLSVAPLETGLDDWLAHYGVTIPKTLLLDDRNQPLPVPEVRNTAFGQLRTWRLAPYPYLVEVRDEGLVNKEVAASLGGMAVYWGSPIEIDEENTKGLQTIEILRSSELSWTDDDLTRVGFVDYQVPPEGTEPHLLSVALTGKFPSYFTGKAVPSPETGEEAAPPSEVPLEESPETRLVVVSNAEFLSDFVARALGTQDGGFFVENLAFMQNLIDWTNLDNEMLSIRSRGAAARRIDRIEPGTEVAIETMAYLVPIVALAMFGAHRMWRRRNSIPIIGTGESGTGQTPRRAEG